MSQIITTAEPFLLLGDRSKPACLLIHGFTGTPKEMRWMGEYLNEHGYTCLGVRLTGHATDPEDMIRSNWTVWTAPVESAFSLLKDLTSDIFLVGLSMGGILSLLMSTRLKVRGVVALSTLYKLPDDPRLRKIDWISKIVAYMPKSDEAPGASWFDKEAWKDHVSYPQNPVRSIGQLNHLLGEMPSTPAERQRDRHRRAGREEGPLSGPRALVPGEGPGPEPRGIPRWPDAPRAATKLSRPLVRRGRGQPVLPADRSPIRLRATG